MLTSLLYAQPTEAAPGESAISQTGDAVSLVTGKLLSWYEALVARLPNLAVALLVLIAFWLLSKLLRRAIIEGVDKVTSNRTVAGLLGSVTKVVVIAVGAFVALSVIGLDKTVTSLLAGAGVIGLALAFAFQDMAANLVSGIFISIREPYGVGDRIVTNDHEGVVEAVDLRNTTLRLPTGEVVLVPNKEVYENVLVNVTAGGHRRVDLGVGVSYGDDLERAKALAVEAVSGLEMLEPGSGVELFYTGFGGSSIDYVVRFWIAETGQAAYLGAKSAAIMAIKRAYDENGITIPFPIRTLDFGIVGGTRLDEVLPAGGGED